MTQSPIRAPKAWQECAGFRGPKVARASRESDKHHDGVTLVRARSPPGARPRAPHLQDEE